MSFRQLPVRHPRTGAVLHPVGYRRSGAAIWPILGGDGNDALSRINELVAKGWEALTDAELAELRGLIGTERDAINTAVEPVEAPHVAAVADIATGMRAETDRRAAGAPAVDPAEARARLDAAFGSPPPAASTAVVAVPVAASAAAVPAPRPAPLSAVLLAAQQAADPGTSSTAPIVASLTAAGGQPLGPVDSAGLADLMSDRLRELDSMRIGGDGVHMLVRSRYALPFRLEGSDLQAHARVLTAASRSALVASGGICRPPTVDYAIPTWSNTDRPLRDALPGVNADRGGLVYSPSPVYDASVYGAGMTIWSEPNDRNPGGANTGPNSNPTGVGPVTKGALDLDCSAVIEVDVQAIVEAITISNFRGRFSPETVESAMSMLSQAWAAKAEAELLAGMRGAAKHVTAPQAFGVTRDALTTVDRALAYSRDRYRLSDSVIMRIVLKRWVRDAIRADLAKAAFPLSTADPAVNSLAITNAQIEAWFAVRGVVPIWTLDDDTGDQTFAAQAPGTAGVPVPLVGYPAVVRFLIYPEGTYQFLDGGELNLGVVRDSVLNAQNKFQVFSETSEVVAFRGFEALDVRASFVVNGASAGTASPA